MTSYIEAVEKLIDQQDEKSIRIEQLVRQRDGWEETALMYAQNVDFWKSKLAMAVEALRFYSPQTVGGITFVGGDDAGKRAAAVLAELEGM